MVREVQLAEMLLTCYVVCIQEGAAQIRLLQ
jgi:hypothetical protein